MKVGQPRSFFAWSFHLQVGSTHLALYLTLSLCSTNVWNSILIAYCLITNLNASLSTNMDPAFTSGLSLSYVVCATYASPIVVASSLGTTSALAGGRTIRGAGRGPGRSGWGRLRGPYCEEREDRHSPIFCWSLDKGRRVISYLCFGMKRANQSFPWEIVT